MTYDGYVNDGTQQEVTDDTMVNVHVDGELKTADNYPMSDDGDQSGDDDVQVNKQRLGRKHYGKLIQKIVVDVNHHAGIGFDEEKHE